MSVPDFLDLGSLADFTDGGASSDIGSLGSLDGAGGDGGSVSLGTSGGFNAAGLSPLEQMFLQGQHVPEVQASSPRSNMSDVFRSGNGGGGAPAKQEDAYSILHDKGAATPAGSSDGFLQKVMRSMGLSSDGAKDGDLQSMLQMGQWLKLLGVGGGLLQSILQRKAPNYQSPSSLMGSQPGGGALGQTWNPSQAASADAFFNSGATPWNQRNFALAQPGQVEQRGHRYAMGGEVAYAGGGLAHTGALGNVAGGQDDVIDAKLAPGEFVWDADAVSALGDGSNEAGARKLEELRQAIREHKRSAPSNKIPPRAKPVMQYMRGGK